MKRYLLILLLCPLLMLRADQPNIILILADDLGWADLGCYGNKFNETPNLDRLAREGMRFTQAYAGPVCSPTRSNLQSGQDQARFGITQHIPGHKRPFAKLQDPVVPLQLPLVVETMAERLAAVGYRTGYFGKWHLGGAGFGPKEQGWQEALELHGNVQSPEVTGSAGVRRTADFLTEKAVHFIEANTGKPFLLQVSHCAVHIPLSTTPELQVKYQAKQPVTGYPCDPTYAGLLEELDQSVGRIVAAVDRTGMAERTLIIFLSDNGGLEHEQGGDGVTSNLPLRGEKGTLYEGGIRVPMMARWRGRIPAQALCQNPVISYDLYPTFTELAGAEAASKQPLDGVSLASLLKNPESTLARDRLHWHLPHYHHSTPASAIRQGDWKLIEFYEDDSRQLYDLSSDLGEKNDRAAQEPERVQQMANSLAEWRQKVGARMPVTNPEYDPARAAELSGKLGAARKKKR